MWFVVEENYFLDQDEAARKASIDHFQLANPQNRWKLTVPFDITRDVIK